MNIHLRKFSYLISQIIRTFTHYFSYEIWKLLVLSLRLEPSAGIAEEL